jgi:hypothetical protein
MPWMRSAPARADVRRVAPRHTSLLPALQKPLLALLVKKTPFSRRTLIDWRAERSRLHPKNQKLLVSILRKLGLV